MMLIKKYIGELWVNIKGYEGLYQVSNFGRVRSLKHVIVRRNGRQFTINNKILNPNKLKSGYLQVQLKKEGDYKCILVHRLVAEAFIPNTKHLPCVNHKDENKTNCKLSNLEWCTYSYNTKYGTCQERRRKLLINNYNMSKIVLQYTKEGMFIKEYPSLSEAARQIGCDIRNISACCRNKKKSIGGFVWKYGTK